MEFSDKHPRTLKNSDSNKKPNGRFHNNSNISGTFSQFSHNSEIEEKTVFRNVCKFLKRFGLSPQRVSSNEWTYSRRNARQALLKVDFTDGWLRIFSVETDQLNKVVRRLYPGHPEITDYQNLKAFCTLAIAPLEAKSALYVDNTACLFGMTAEAGVTSVQMFALMSVQKQSKVSLLENVGGSN